jgi:hypothetical protein
VGEGEGLGELSGPQALQLCTACGIEGEVDVGAQVGKLCNGQGSAVVGMWGAELWDVVV